MKPITKESLIEEIVHNARRDRVRLESAISGLIKNLNEVSETSEDSDPEVSAAFAEEISKVTDSLSKVDQRLVELVKLETKKEENPKKGNKGLTAEEKEQLFDEVQEMN